MSQETSNTMNDQKINTFGQSLKAAREAMRLDTKDIAGQLRLNERIILMLESDQYDSELPIAFLKGYIRAYGKLVQLPDETIQQAITPLQPKEAYTDPGLQPPAEGDITSRNYRMQFATAIIGLTLIGLLGTWWHNHSTAQNHTLAPIPMNLPASVEAAPTPQIHPPLALPSLNTTTDHPLVNAIAQQMNPPGSTTAPVAKGEDKPDNAEKPSAPARKAAPAKATNADEDDNDDEDNVDDTD